jgi:hypothetical protein
MFGKQVIDIRQLRRCQVYFGVDQCFGWDAHKGDHWLYKDSTGTPWLWTMGNPPPAPHP